MFRDLTRAGMRDDMRRMLGLVPAVDANPTNGVPGDPGPHQPLPNNAMLNLCLDLAVSEINRKAGWVETSSPILVSFAAATANGPVLQDLAHDTTSFSAAGNQINSVRSARWQNTGDTTWTPLSMTSYYELDRKGYDWRSDPPGTPVYAIVQGYSLQLTPPPASAGQVSMLCGVGLLNPLSDSDTLGQLPGDYYPCVLANALQYVVAQVPDDSVMQQRAAFWLPKAVDGVHDIAEWIQTVNAEYQPRLVPDTSRRMFG